MLLAKLPYFLTREEWYAYDINKGIYVLTDAGKAIPEVVKSYKEFYKLLETVRLRGPLPGKRQSNSLKTRPRRR